jgi:hypothetical protein
MMRSENLHSEPLVVTVVYTLATSLGLAYGGAGLATDPFAMVAALFAGIPWPLAVRWQPETWLVGLLVTIVAMGLNIFGLWWWAGKSRH